MSPSKLNQIISVSKKCLENHNKVLYFHKKSNHSCRRGEEINKQYSSMKNFKRAKYNKIGASRPLFFPQKEEGTLAHLPAGISKSPERKSESNSSCDVTDNKFFYKPKY